MPRRIPRVARRGLGFTGDSHLVSDEALLHEDVAGEHCSEREREQHVQPGALDERGQQRSVFEHLRLREIESLRILPGPVHQPGHDELGDVDEHQRNEDLVGVETDAKDRGDRCPQRAADRAGDDHRRQQHCARAALEVQRDPAAGNGARDELPLGADVPDVCAESDGKADRDQRQRRCLEQKLGDAVRVLERAQKEDAEAFERIRAERREDGEAGDECEHRGNEWRRKAHRARRLRPRVEPRPHRRLPAPAPHRATGRSSTRRSPRCSSRSCVSRATACRWR